MKYLIVHVVAVNQLQTTCTCTAVSEEAFHVKNIIAFNTIQYIYPLNMAGICFETL